MKSAGNRASLDAAETQVAFLKCAPIHRRLTCASSDATRIENIERR